MNDTPETDEAINAALHIYGPSGIPVTLCDHARKLERERDNAKAAVTALVRENGRLRDARAKAENGECLLELTIGLLEQDIATIREIIAKGGTAAEVLKFLDTPNA